MLIVEDESIIALDIEEHLSRAGYRVVGNATNEEDAIELFREHHPSIVLMDIQLSAGSSGGPSNRFGGIEAASRMQRESGVPVVYLTSFSDRDSIDRVKRTDFYGYVLKPFQERELLVALELAIEKYQMRRELEESKHLLKTTLDHLSEGVIRTDSSGTVTYMNPAAERFTGWNCEEGVGKALDTVFVTSTLLPRPGSDQSWGTLTSASGVQTFVECRASSVNDGAESAGGNVIAFRDITLEKRYQEYVSRAMVAAEESARSRTLLLSAMSHSMISSTRETRDLSNLLAHSSEGEPSHDLASRLREEAESSLTILEEVVDLLDFEAGRRKYEPIGFDLVESLYEVMALCARRADRNGRHLVILYSPDLHRGVRADKRVIQRAMQSMVEWAIDTTAEDEVAISVNSGGPVADGRSTYEITISNSESDAMREIVENSSAIDRPVSVPEIRFAVGTRLLDLINSGSSAMSSALPANAVRVHLSVDTVMGFERPPPGQLKTLSVCIVSPSSAFIESVSTHLVSWGVTVRAYWDMEEFRSAISTLDRDRMVLLVSSSLLRSRAGELSTEIAPEHIIQVAGAGSAPVQTGSDVDTHLQLQEPVRAEDLHRLLSSIVY